MLKHALAGLALFWASLSHADPRLVTDIPLEIDGLGGFSAIDLADNGRDFVLLTDRGILMTGQINRSANNEIRGYSVTESAPLLGRNGTPLTRPRYDAEGLAWTGSGRIYVSFENPARVWGYDTVSSDPYPIARAPEFRSMQPNSALEALAIDKNGALYTSPERSGELDRPFPVYRYTDTWETAFQIPRRDKFLVVGADIGPDDRFYLLERDFVGIGFRTRIRRFDLDGGNETLILDTPLGKHSNLEGIAVWRAPNGNLRMTLVSDNNETRFISSRLVEYELDD